MRIRKIGDYQYKGTCGFYAEADATETTTFKCEGCGKRRRAQDNSQQGAWTPSASARRPALCLQEHNMTGSATIIAYSRLSGIDKKL